MSQPISVQDIGQIHPVQVNFAILKWLPLLTENVDTIPDLVVDFPEMVLASRW